MKITESKPYKVMERFPEHREAIQYLFNTDSTFKTLCSDYLRCAKALLFWSKSPLCEAEKRKLEYETLLQELESELLKNIEKQAN